MKRLFGFSKSITRMELNYWRAFTTILGSELHENSTKELDIRAEPDSLRFRTICSSGNRPTFKRVFSSNHGWRAVSSSEYVKYQLLAHQVDFAALQTSTTRLARPSVNVNRLWWLKYMGAQLWFRVWSPGCVHREERALRIALTSWRIHSRPVPEMG